MLSRVDVWEVDLEFDWRVEFVVDDLSFDLILTFWVEFDLSLDVELQTWCLMTWVEFDLEPWVRESSWWFSLLSWVWGLSWVGKVESWFCRCSTWFLSLSRIGLTLDSTWVHDLILELILSILSCYSTLDIECRVELTLVVESIFQLISVILSRYSTFDMICRVEFAAQLDLTLELSLTLSLDVMSFQPILGSQGDVRVGNSTLIPDFWCCWVLISEDDFRPKLIFQCVNLDLSFDYDSRLMSDLCARDFDWRVEPSFVCLVYRFSHTLAESLLREGGGE